MTASRTFHSCSVLNRIDETCGIVTIDEADLFVNEENLDWQKHIHHLMTGQNTAQEFTEFLSRYVPFHREPTQPQNMIRQPSRDTTMPISKNTHKRQAKDQNTSIKRLAEAIAGIASQQRTATSAILKPASTNIIMFIGKNEKIQLFEIFFHTMLSLLSNKNEVLRINPPHAHLKKDELRIFYNNNATNKRTH